MPLNHQRGIAEEHPNSHLIQIAAAIIFFLIWFLDFFIFTIVTIMFMGIIPLICRLLLFASLLIIGGFLIFRTGHNLFHRKNGAPELITTGIFAHVRHPLYIGALLIYLGFVLLSTSLISIIGWIIVFILHDRIASFEEKDLERVLGQEYLEYKKKVPKWFPRK